MLPSWWSSYRTRTSSKGKTCGVITTAPRIFSYEYLLRLSVLRLLLLSFSAQQGGGTTSWPPLPLPSAHAGNSPGHGISSGVMAKYLTTTATVCTQTAGDSHGRCVNLAILCGLNKIRSNYGVPARKASHTHVHNYTPKHDRRPGPASLKHPARWMDSVSHG